MKFLVDAHLPLAICDALTTAGHDAVHTRHLPDENRTTDQSINELSVKEKRIVISKDTDFYYSHVLAGKPWRLILVRTGNISGRDLTSIFHSHLPAIEAALTENTLIELDHEEIRIVR